MRAIDADSLTDVYTIYDDYGDKHTVIDASDVASAQTLNAIVILENATLRDVIKAVFPDVKWFVNEDNEVFTDHRTKNSTVIRIDANTWNAPYKGVDK